MMHTHVSLADIELCLHAKETGKVCMRASVYQCLILRATYLTILAALIVCPCCNWYSKQLQWYGRPADIVYDDVAINSLDNHVRIWLPVAVPQQIVAEHPDDAYAQLEAMNLVSSNRQE